MPAEQKQEKNGYKRNCSIWRQRYKPLDDVQDLIIIGASKIKIKGMQYSEWAKEMLSEYGEIIKENLPYIWHRAKELNLHGETKIKFEGAEILVKQADSELPKGNLQENIKKSDYGQNRTLSGEIHAGRR